MDVAQAQAQMVAEDVAAAREHAGRTALLNQRLKVVKDDYLRPSQQRANGLKARVETEHGDAAALWSKYDGLMDQIEVFYDYLYSVVASAVQWRYSTEEVKGWFQTAVDLGCVRPPVGRQLIEDLMYVRKVPNAPFRAVVQRLMDGDQPLPESSHVLGSEPLKRIVGIEAHSQPGHTKSLRLFVHYEQGVILANLLGLTPRQAGV